MRSLPSLRCELFGEGVWGGDGRDEARLRSVNELAVSAMIYVSKCEIA